MLRTRGIDSNNYYKAFHPLVRLKGHLIKMHATKLTKYQRFMYLNPIEGVLITYKTANKFPHQPHNIMHLNNITTLEFMRETRWYHSRGQYYMKVATPSKTAVFFDDNLDVVNFWVSQIDTARKFYVWLQYLIKIRYKIRQKSCINNCDVVDCTCSIDGADNLINTVMKLLLPEVDMDQYSARLQISANDYAVRKATEFMTSVTSQKRPPIDKGTSSSSNQRSFTSSP